MQTLERSEGIYAIEAMAIQAPAGGFHASVVIRRSLGDRMVEAYRNERLESERAFDQRELALRHALDHGRAVIRRRPSLLAC